MIVLAAADTLAAVASAATQVTCTIFGMELNGTTETYKVLDQRQLASTVATIYTAPGSTTAFIKSIHVVNNDTVARTFQIFRGGTAAANAITPAITLAASGGFALYNERGWTIYTANGLVQSGLGGTLLRVTNILQGTTSFVPGASTRVMYVEMVGGGSGGGGCATAVTNAAAAGGGGAGAFSAIYTTTIKTYTVQVGAGGNGGTAGANNGSAGTDSTFDTGPSICTAKGSATGGIADSVAAGPRMGGSGGVGGLASGGLGDIKADGGPGEVGVALAAAQACSGRGGASYFGGGSPSIKNTTAAGANAVVYGSGGSGACIISGGASQAGGNGANGLIRVWEFA